MTNQTKRVILSTAAIIAAVMFIAPWVSQSAQVLTIDTTSDRAAEKRIGESPSNQVEVESQMPLLSVSARSKNLDAVTKFSLLLSTPEMQMRGQELEQLRSAASYCESRATTARLSVQSSQQPSATEVFHRQFAKTFCDRPTDSGRATSLLFALDPKDEVLQSHMLINLEGADISEVAVPAAQQLVLNASSADAVVRAAEFLVYGQHEDLPQVTSVRMPPSIQGEMRAKAQVLAASMAACEMRGGCGPNGLYTALNCANACRLGTSLYDIWTQEYSPDVITYADALAKKIGKRK